MGACGACCGDDKGNQEAYLTYSGKVLGIKPTNQKRDSIEERKYH